MPYNRQLKYNKHMTGTICHKCIHSCVLEQRGSLIELLQPLMAWIRAVFQAGRARVEHGWKANLNFPWDPSGCAIWNTHLYYDKLTYAFCMYLRISMRMCTGGILQLWSQNHLTQLSMKYIRGGSKCSPTNKVWFHFRKSSSAWVKVVPKTGKD